ncbi:Rpn family recombination-promoting nuclease/putative transposase [Ornithobacterium rhinotracheale]|uniref:Rpn family recombination-promoting nuclease/putative transposase n=1 Tax=Ornithobacterium rhinotracheale TaxID=28251 RepID=UPI00129C7EA4|nr:Rpn family recombination-promoting nuclease/putative transposase [Ornithobacterium rhinotracheale]MRI64248.1 Rpn family recombination-promoting nuclease/putative transposase [Ornithobacterium rhinotracheale]MRJ11596.1 Rpn family recombination-promoting nuclease/putative transposase [Ornithobacterium rhinotracheale]
MKHFIEKYINPFTDYGFKKIFGEEPNKDLLLDFLNELLYEEQGRIVSLTYLKNEHLSSSELDRKAIFDLYCENEKGEKFIVELQKAKQNFFKDRTLYYSTFPIREQAQKADWNYELKAVYTIAILDFVFDEDKENAEKFRYDIKLSDIETNKVFYDKLTFIYLEMPKFNKSVEELETRFDKWLYVLRNLNRLDRVPEKLKERIFEKLFEVAEIAKFTPSQVYSYEDSLKYYRDLKNSLDTAKEEGFEEGKEQGREEGREEEKLKIAKNLLESNVSIEVIIKTTGLTQEQIEHLEF